MVGKTLIKASDYDYAVPLRVWIRDSNRRSGRHPFSLDNFPKTLSTMVILTRQGDTERVMRCVNKTLQKGRFSEGGHWRMTGVAVG